MEKKKTRTKRARSVERRLGSIVGKAKRQCRGEKSYAQKDRERKRAKYGEREGGAFTEIKQKEKKRQGVRKGGNW